MKKPIELIRADTGVAEFFCCAVCGSFCGADETYATYHCGGRPCEVCGEPSKRYFTKCDDCRSKEQEEKRQKRIAKAECVCAGDYGGPVYWEEHDAYYAYADDAFDALKDYCVADVDGAREQTFWVCDTKNLTIDAEGILQASFEFQEHADESWDAIPDEGFRLLKDFCTMWNEKYGSSVETWFPTRKRVVFPETWWEEYVDEVVVQEEEEVVVQEEEEVVAEQVEQNQDHV